MRFFSNPLAFLRNLRSAEPLTNKPDLQQPENPKKIQRQNQYNFKGRSYFKKSVFSSPASQSTLAGFSSTKGSIHFLRVRPSWLQGSKFCAFSADGSHFLNVFSNPLPHFGQGFVILHVVSDPLAAGHSVEPLVRAAEGSRFCAFSGNLWYILAKDP